MTASDQLHGFPLDDHELLIAGEPLSRLVAATGTPCYLYDTARIAAQIERVRAILPNGFHLHYAVKANPFPPLLQFLAARVDGFDIASGGELDRALAAGMPGHHISFAGPGKRRSELAQALAADVLIHAESRHELDTLAALAQANGRTAPARVALRINPAFELKGAGMRMGGGPRPFGIDEEAIPALLAEWPQRYGETLAFAGFHIYAGSQNLDGSAIAAAQRASYELALRLAAYAPGPVTSLNLGGGFGIPYFAHEQALDLAPIALALQEIAALAALQLPAARLCIELGRYLVGPAGLYVTEVIDTKTSRGQDYLVVNGGLNHHLAATGNFGQVIRRNFPVALQRKVNVTERNPLLGTGGTAQTRPTSVVGPLCTPLDLLADRVDLPTAQIGDLFVIFQSGAYGASASPQAFLSYPTVIEAIV